MFFYDFGELVNAIQANPSGEFKLGQSLSARNIVPNENLILLVNLLVNF